jgi:hypothetical protein
MPRPRSITGNRIKLYHNPPSGRFALIIENAGAEAVRLGVYQSTSSDTPAVPHPAFISALKKCLR